MFWVPRYRSLQSCVSSALNALNKDEKFYRDIKVDGAYGPTTHTRLQNFLGRKNVSLLVKSLNILQGAFYFKLVKEKPSLEAFIEGWILNRIEIKQ